MINKICSVCGKEYETKKPTQKTCSHPCRDESMRGRKNEWMIGNSYAKGNTPPNKKYVPIPCGNCNKLFKPRVKRNKFCCRVCARAKQVITSESRRRALATRRAKYGYINSPATREKLAKIFSGSKSHLWRGGISKLVKLIRQSLKYRTWRTECFERDNWTCTKCEAKGDMQVDHIKSFSLILRENKIKSLKRALSCKELWELSNGRTLCIPCHKQTDTYAKNLV